MLTIQNPIASANSIKDVNLVNVQNSLRKQILIRMQILSVMLIGISACVTNLIRIFNFAQVKKVEEPEIRHKNQDDAKKRLRGVQSMKVSMLESGAPLVAKALTK